MISLFGGCPSIAANKQITINVIDEKMKIESTDLQNTPAPGMNYIPCYQLPFLSLFHADCMDIMKQYPDKYFDLAIVDPPYGIGGFTQSETKKYGDYKWNEAPPPEEYFAELKRVSKERIIWGANYYNCFDGGNAAIVWNKQNPHPSLSVCEIASVSWGKRIAYFEYQWHGLAMHRIRSGFHPCEKPVALYEWILKNYAKPNDLILDTHFGSGSIALAVDKANRLDKMNLHLTACEIDKEYIDKAIKRISESIKQGTLSF